MARAPRLPQGGPAETYGASDPHEADDSPRPGEDADGVRQITSDPGNPEAPEAESPSDRT
ncbi:MAG: hypothetical protein QM695_15740 [Micropruina sp.]